MHADEESRLRERTRLPPGHVIGGMAEWQLQTGHYQPRKFGRQTEPFGGQTRRLGRQIRRAGSQARRFGRQIRRAGGQTEQFGRQIPRAEGQTRRLGRQIPRAGRQRSFPRPRDGPTSRDSRARRRKRPVLSALSSKLIFGRSKRQYHRTGRCRTCEIWSATSGDLWMREPSPFVKSYIRVISI